MRPVSDAFNRIIRGSHTMCARAVIVTGFSTGVNPAGVEVSIISGDVIHDSSADVRGTLDLTIDGTNLWPLQPNGLVTPYGNEVFIQRGVITGGDGSRELVSQGYFRMYVVEQLQLPDNPIHIQARDRMSGLIDARMMEPVQFLSGTSIDSIFDLLVHAVYPLATILFDFDAVASTIESNQICDENRYTFLRDLVKSRGKVMFWDYAGRLRVEDAPDPSVTVLDVNAGTNGILINMDRKLNREGVYNAVVARGEAPTDESPPVHAIATDMNPNSPTFFNGPFGPVPRFYMSPFITTLAQAQTAAQKILERALGLPYQVTFASVPHPGLEPLDPVRVIYADRYENHIIEKITLPLTHAEPMTANTRELTDFDIEVT